MEPPAEAGLDHHDRLQHHRRERQLKRSSLPPRPHAAARHTKRLTLNFPINIPAASLNTASSVSDLSASSPMTPATTQASTRPSPSFGTPLPLETQEDDGSGLLTAIASQERKVLELKEELSRAETELSTLKRQWAFSEKNKKQTEVSYHAEPLVSLRSPIQPVEGDESIQQGQQQPDGSQRTKELERRRSMRAAASPGTSISANGRRVFQGSHARTLSLVSASTDSGFSKPAPKPENEVMNRPPRSATLPSSTERSSNHVVAGPSSMEPTEDTISQWRKTMPPPSREALMRTGKQMASDLREGLWTFLEDIRQATVGEEGINATEARGVASPVPRNRDSTSTSRSRERLSVQGERGLSRSVLSASSRGTEARISGKDTKSTDIDSSFWSEFGIDTPGQKSPNARAPSNPPRGLNAHAHAHVHDLNHNHLELDDDWDAWDNTPQPKKMQHTPSSSRSTFESKQDQSPRSQISSPRTSTR